MLNNKIIIKFIRGGKSNYLTCLFSLIFVILIFLPISLRLLKIDFNWGLINENRSLVTKPKYKEYNLKDLTKLYDDYFKDRMPFRQFFLTSYIYLSENLLSSYELEEISGKDGDKFYNTKNAPIFEENLGLHPYPSDATEWLRLSEAGKYAYFYSKHIPYYLFIIPDKATLYPEKLPFYSTWINHEGWYKYQIDAINHAKIPFYNLKEILEKNKLNYRLYDKFFDNGHWNGNALITVYPYIDNVIHKNNNTLEFLQKNKDYSCYKKDVSFGVYGKETTTFVKLNNMDKISCGSLPQNIQGRTTGYEKLCVNNDRDKGTLWFFSDSYFGSTHGSEAVTPFVHLFHTYLHSHYTINHPYTFSKLATERFDNGFKPDAVIFEFVERQWGGGMYAYYDYLLRILGDIWLQTGGYLLDLNSNISDFNLTNAQLLNKVNEADFDQKKRFVLNASNSDPIIKFKHSVTADYLGRAVVMAKYISPADSFAQVFYSTADSPNISEKKSVSQQIHAGENLVHLTVHVKPFEKVYLRFAPGAVPGQYIFENIPEVEDLRKRMQEDGL